MSTKWRPSLAFVLGGGLGGTLAMSLVGLVIFRYLGPDIGFKNAAALIGAVICLATAVIGWLLVRLLLRPIRDLDAYAAQVRLASDRDTVPPEHFGTRELNATATSVIEMASVLRDREATIRSFTDHATHEIKSPVTAIRAATELLEDGASLGVQDAALVAQIDGAARQIEAQLNALRNVAQARESRYLGETRLDTLRDWATETYPALTITTEGAEVPLPMATDGMKLVLGHLLDNANAHGASRVSLIAQAGVKTVSLEVSDNGSGISAGNQSRVFDPFFTTQRDSGGTGMGLSIVRNILAAHGGDITLTSGDQGARFTLRFDLP